jgi:hypothetical protein
MARRRGRPVGVGIYERNLRCGCVLEMWRHSNYRSPPCSFHARADADLKVHEWQHLSLPRRLARTAIPVGYLSLIVLAPTCAFAWLLSGSRVIAVLPMLVLPLLWCFIWRASAQSSSPARTVAFTGAIEPGDYGPQDLEMVGEKYVPRGHSNCEKV